MATGQIWGKIPETILLEDFTDANSGITLTAETILQTRGFSGSHYQCLVGDRKFVWVPKNITKTE
ncbi:MAG: hypothetical protein PHZ04_00050 [Patescibacteria group bacterium]|nr:hypothetical protein [Patescibacteria group bacterium]MDD5294985.1 hypothetical protein [Patescibacteria group bacterium]MDD5554539.1 hypothetical protein [Patescibacteria group bacterium]